MIGIGKYKYVVMSSIVILLTVFSGASLVTGNETGNEQTPSRDPAMARALSTGVKLGIKIGADELLKRNVPGLEDPKLPNDTEERQQQEKAMKENKMKCGKETAC